MRRASLAKTLKKDLRLRKLRNSAPSSKKYNWEFHHHAAKRIHFQKKNKRKLIALISAIFFLILITFFILRPALTGLVIGESESEHSIYEDLFFNKSGTYNLTTEQLGEITSLAVSGEISKFGLVKITINNLIIFDSTKLTEKQLNISKTGKIIGALTGKVTDEKDPTEKPTEEKIEEGSKKEPKEKKFENKPVKKEKEEKEKETIEEDVSSESTNIQPKEEEVVNQTSPQETTPSPEVVEEKNLTEEEYPTTDNEQQITDNKTDIQPKEEEVTNQTSPQEATPSPEVVEGEKNVIEFIDYCSETCIIQNLNEPYYIINIEINNSNITLKKIKYRIRNPEDLVIENITEILKEDEILETQEQIEIEKPVKWKKIVHAKPNETIKVHLPKNSKNIEVKKDPEEKEETTYTIKETIIVENKPLFQRSTLTSQTIEAREVNETLEIVIDDNATTYEIYYETEPPKKEETEISLSKKEITIYTNEELNYTDVLAFTELPTETTIDLISLYHINGNSYTNFTAYDLNNNSLIDYIEWIVPHLSNQTYELELQLFIENITHGKQDFFIQRGYTIIPNGQTTAIITSGTNYLPITGNAFIRIVGTKLTASGKTSGGGNQNSDDYTVFIQNPSNLNNEIIFERFGSLNDDRISWEIIEYIGPLNGGNEFKIRESNNAIFSVTNLTYNTNSIPGISDNNDIVVFITSQATSDTGRGNAQSGLHTANWIPNSQNAEFKRGGSGDLSQLSYAIIEFTGENWRTQRIEHQYYQSGVIEIEPITQIASINKTFLHIQHRTGNKGLDELGSNTYLSSNSEITFEIQSGANIIGQNTVAWIIENIQLGNNQMNVQHISGIKPDGLLEETIWIDTINPILLLNSTSIIGENTKSTGTGTALPRGFHTLQLISETEVEQRTSDNGQTQTYKYDIVEWPTELAKSAPTINLISPENNLISKTIPLFKFNTTDESITPLLCSLILDNGTKEIYWFNSSIQNATEIEINLSNIEYGVYKWHINCSNGALMASSEKRNLLFLTNLSTNIFQDSNGDLVCNFTEINGIDYSVDWVENNDTMQKLNLDFNENFPKDISGTNTITGTAEYIQDARNNSGAYYFNGSTFLEISNNIESWLGHNSSISFWIKTNQTGSDTNWLAPGITGIEEAGGTNDVFWGIIDATGRIGAAAGDSPMAKTQTPINDFKWYNIVITRDESTGLIRIFKDGLFEVSSISGLGAISNTFTKIGVIEDTGGTPEYFIGYLDNLILFDRILSDEQINLFSNDELNILHKNDALIGSNYSCTVNFYYKNESLATISSDIIELLQNQPPTAPTTITCDGGPCNGSFLSPINLQCSGSTDKENNQITYEIYSHAIEKEIHSKPGYLEITEINYPNYSKTTCSDYWGIDCSIGPPETLSNTIDLCDSGIGNDESIEEIHINSTQVKINDTIEITCEVNPYTSGDDAYIFYNDGINGWTKIYEQLNFGSTTNINISTTLTPSQNTGTHYIRCSIGYDADLDISTDHCYDTGSWYDNDDIGFKVIQIEELIESNTTEKEYSVLGNDLEYLDTIYINFNISSYNPEASVSNNNNKPDLFLSIWDASNWIEYSQINLSSYYLQNSTETINKEITLIIKNTSIINAWKTQSNQKFRINAINMDATQIKSDHINYTNIKITLETKNTSYVENHIEGEYINWNITNFANSINELSCRAIDDNASGKYSNYLTIPTNITEEFTGISSAEIEIYKNLMTDISIGLNEGPLSTFVSIKFQATHSIGFQRFVDSTAKIEFLKSGEELRNITCSRLENESSIKSANYTCIISMQFWDAPGTWKINASIQDNTNNYYEDSSQTFIVGATSGFFLSKSSIEWDELNPGAKNIIAKNSLILNNIGNIQKNIEINSTNLAGTTDSSKKIFANDFSIDTQVSCIGTIMQNHSFVAIQNALLTKGDYRINDSTAKEELFICLIQTPEDLTQQQYSTNTEGAWVIRIFALLLTTTRKKKILERTKKAITELKKQGLLDEEIFEIINPEIKEVLQEKEIPINIFKKEMGALESIVKYMKENLNFTYAEIGRKLNRNQRTIWTAYSKSKEKNSNKIKIQRIELSIPIERLQNKNLTILESIILYLRGMEMKYSEIGKLLNRDQRNIWTINSRVKRKI